MQGEGNRRFLDARKKKEISNLKKAVEGANASLRKFADEDIRIVGPEAPLPHLRNPGLDSIPLGFLCVIIGSRCCTATSAPK